MKFALRIEKGCLYLYNICLQIPVFENKFDRVDSSVVEHPAFNRLVEGSKPSQPILTTFIKQSLFKKVKVEKSKKSLLGNC